MKVKVVGRKMVKPCTPTPENRKTYKISFMDELNPTMNVLGILYYQQGFTDENLNQLEQSLSEILPQFHPFAGRYMKKHHLVDCSDQGAQLIVANVDDLELLQVIDPESKITPEELNDLLPCEIGAADMETDPILSIQINKFTCGGIAISICISHRIIDACSLGVFISAWTNASRGDNREAICPSFDGPVVFPGKGFPTPEFGTTRTRENGLYNILCKRFIFDRNAISGLRQRAAITCESPRPLSKVQLVSGLIIQAIAGLDKARNEPSKDLLVAQAVNIRERTVPPLSKHSCGNLAALAITECSADETKIMGFQDYVRVLANDARKTVNDCAKILSEDGHRFMIDTSVHASEKTLSPHVNVVWLTDWSKFRFYEADFGWGKPVWASVTNVVIKNHVLLMNTKEGDGLEAWVQLQENDMNYFENEVKYLVNKLKWINSML